MPRAGASPQRGAAGGFLRPRSRWLGRYLRQVHRATCSTTFPWPWPDSTRRWATTAAARSGTWSTTGHSEPSATPAAKTPSLRCDGPTSTPCRVMLRSTAGSKSPASSTIDPTLPPSLAIGRLAASVHSRRGRRSCPAPGRSLSVLAGPRRRRGVQGTPPPRTRAAAPPAGRSRGNHGCARAPGQLHVQGADPPAAPWASTHSPGLGASWSSSWIAVPPASGSEAAWTALRPGGCGPTSARVASVHHLMGAFLGRGELLQAHGLRPTRLVNDERACRRDPRQPQGQLVGKRTTSRPGVRMAHA